MKARVIRGWIDPYDLRPEAVPGVVYVGGQEYGFTREDVEILREAEEELGFMHMRSVYGAPLTSLADRIQALLPPEGEDG